MNKLCLARNLERHATTLDTLEEMAGRAAKQLANWPQIRKREPVASGIIDGFYGGGRELIMKACPVQNESKGPCPRLRLYPQEA